MLPDRAFLKVGGRITLEGGSGGGGGGTSTQTSTAYQTNIPAYLEDPTKRMVARGETLSEQAYEPYKGERVSGFTPEQLTAFREIGGMGTPSQFGEAGAAVTGAERFGTAGAMGAMGYTPEMCMWMTTCYASKTCLPPKTVTNKPDTRTNSYIPRVNHL